MAYTVKEIFYSLQGEGFHSGRPAIFCRFTGCNLWNGLENSRETALCRFCDTDFVGTNGNLGGKYSAEHLAQTMANLCSEHDTDRKFCVLTGGEPALQFDEALKRALHDQGFEIAIETNGTVPLAALPDWVCVSPKGNNAICVTSGDELKLVYPQPMHTVDPQAFASLAFTYHYLQPLDSPIQDYRAQCVQYCLDHPKWTLSLQLHKLLGIE